LSEIKRENDVIARIGGDEFAMICPNTTSEIMEMQKEKLKKLIASQRVEDIQYSLAIGYEIKSNIHQNIRDVLKEAENYMYKNKVFEGKSTKNDAILSILQTLTNKYNDEKIHSERVSQYCKKIGEALQLRPEEIRELEVAGMFHDIGKISIPDAILDKPGKLTTEEFEIMKTHTINGYQILRAADRFSNLAEYAMSHHERIDGKGYPNGIKGDEIPLFAKIIAVADSYEAMTSNRVYRKALSQEDAIKELINNKGTQFDAEIVDLFLKVVLKVN